MKPLKRIPPDDVNAFTDVVDEDSGGVSITGRFNFDDGEP